MKWQTQVYYDSQKKTLRPGTYLRLHRNQWAVAEETFITPELWDPCVNLAYHPNLMTRDPLFVGVDVGIKHDKAARMGQTLFELLTELNPILYPADDLRQQAKGLTFTAKPISGISKLT